MSDLTSRLSKAVFDYLETANLRQEPFSLFRIEEVIAGVMATDSKVPVNVVRHPEYLAQQKIPIQVFDQAYRKRQAERAALEQYWATIRGRTEPTAPVTYDLAKDPDAFEKARVGDMVICEIGKDLVGYGDHQKWSCQRIMNSECNRWTRIA